MDDPIQNICVVFPVTPGARHFVEIAAIPEAYPLKPIARRKRCLQASIQRLSIQKIIEKAADNGEYQDDPDESIEYPTKSITEGRR